LAGPDGFFVVSALGVVGLPGWAIAVAWKITAMASKLILQNDFSILMYLMFYSGSRYGKQWFNSK
jgi:hypothetical protein